MTIKNKGTGAGGANTNKSGLPFESIIQYEKQLTEKKYKLVISPINNKCTSSLQEIKKNDILMGYIGQKHTLYSLLEHLFPNVNFQERISKKLLPDWFFYNIKTSTLYVNEHKNQNFAGSVDEKIQTAPYKVWVYKKLLRDTNIKIHFTYVLSEMFSLNQYKDSIEYNKINNVNVFIDGLNIDKLDVSEYFEN